MGEIMKS